MHMRILAVTVGMISLLLWVETGCQMEPLILRNSYPDTSNYSVATLTCYEGSEMRLAEGAVFLWNDTRDAESEMSVSKGEMTFVLTQETEGKFHCEKNGTASNNTYLAAQPHSVRTVSEIPIATNATYIVTDLHCGIQPGALAQKYTVSWSNNSLNLSLSDSAFNLSLNLTVEEALSSVYQCDVTVDHDEVHSRTYSGGSFKFTLDNSVCNETMLCHHGEVCINSEDGKGCICQCHNGFTDTTETTTIPLTRPAPTDFPATSRGARAHWTEIIVGTVLSTAVILSTPIAILLFYLNCKKSKSKTKNRTGSHSDEERHRNFLHENKEVYNLTEILPVPDAQVDDVDHQDPDPVGGISLCVISDNNSVPSSTGLTDESMPPEAHRLHIHELMHISSSAEPTEGVCVDSGSRLPEWMYKLHTLTDCTEKGVVYEQYDYGFILEVLEGAIPHGLSLMIEIGISLYGPFLYPKGDRRVSPIVWVCVRDQENFRFLKPVRLTLQHCLDVGDMVDSESLGLRFLKASHSQNSEGFHTFESTEGTVSTSSDPNYLILSTNHFCYLCITSNTLPDTLERIQYCLSPYYPQPVLYNENDKLHFYVSFFLCACLTIIDKQCGGKYKKANRQCFSFTQDNHLTISFSDPERWLLTLQCNDEISAGDVDFLHKDHVQLRMEEEEGMYPPKFTVGLLSLEAAESTKVHFEFQGAKKKIAMDIPLHIERPGSSIDQWSSLPPTPASTTTPWREWMPLAPYQIPKTSIPLKTFMEKVAVHVRTKWRFFGIMIDIPSNILDSFPAHNALHCFERVFDYWSRRGSPPLTWEAIVEVLESDTVDEKKIADEVRKAFLPPLQTAPQGIEHSTSNESQYSQQTKSSDTGYASNQSAGIHTSAEDIARHSDIRCANDISKLHLQADNIIVSGSTTAPYAASKATSAD